MFIATCHLKSAGVYSQSRYVTEPRGQKEPFWDYEVRTWWQRCHYNENGEITIPPMALKNCLTQAAKYLGQKIKGHGTKTYTARFTSGVLVTDPVPIGHTRETLKYEDLFLPSDGKTGGGKRVLKRMPYVPQWEADAKFVILDELITKDVFTEHLIQAGQFVGIGRFRPANNGYYGRFSVESVKWQPHTALTA